MKSPGTWVIIEFGLKTVPTPEDSGPVRNPQSFGLWRSPLEVEILSQGAPGRTTLIPSCSSLSNEHSPPSAITAMAESSFKEKQWSSTTVDDLGFYLLYSSTWPLRPTKKQLHFQRKVNCQRPSEFRGTLALGNGEGGWCPSWLLHQPLRLTPVPAAMERGQPNFHKAQLACNWKL